jgi:hypothetical protein
VEETSEGGQDSLWVGSVDDDDDDDLVYAGIASTLNCTTTASFQFITHI